MVGEGVDMIVAVVVDNTVRTMIVEMVSMAAEGGTTTAKKTDTVVVIMTAIATVTIIVVVVVEMIDAIA